MSKLTPADIRTIETFFASPMGTKFTDGIAAQTYEPRGAGYQPSTDMRLAGLVLRGVRPGKSAWTRASCVVDQLVGKPGGGVHLDVLRNAIRSRAAVGSHTARAMAYGHELAKDAARMSELESEHRACERRGLSTFETTARILALETKLYGRPVEVSLGTVALYAHQAVAERLINVDAEIDALVDAAADALHAAQARVLEAERGAERSKDARGVALRAELADKKLAKNKKARRAAQLLVECQSLLSQAS